MLKVFSGRSAGQKGFTLIEMSIVLVIIGLIIGGILKGQEVISNARNKATWNMVNAARAASNTYFDRYRALPGDDPNAATRVDDRLASGDGSGIVGATHATPAAAFAADGGAGEPAEYFNGLMAANLLNGGEVVDTPDVNAFGPGSPLPPAPITGSGLLVAYALHTGNGVNATTNRSAHWYLLAKTPATPAESVSPRELQAIDTQFDDGNGSFGAVRAQADAACVTIATGVYVLSDDILCIPFLEAHP